jgi:hypothetical protein
VSSVLAASTTGGCSTSTAPSATGTWRCDLT